jgi:photosystem II stability/assembly factor-like uncharacterized protein
MRNWFFACILLSACLPAANRQPEPFFQRIGPFGGDVRSLLIDEKRPSIAYLGTSDGRIYRSADEGRTWQLLLPGIGHPTYVIDSLVQSPDDPDRIFAGAWDLSSSGGGLFESLDGGSNWHELSLGPTSPAVKKVAVSRSNPGRIAVATLSGLYLTESGGKSWKISGSFRNVHSVALEPRDPDFIFAGTWQLGYRSDNFGKSWQRVEKGMPADSDIFSVSAAPQSAIYAGACSGIYRSDDKARSWVRLKAIPDRFVIRTQVVTVDPSQPLRLYAGTTEGLYSSADGGENWKRLTSPEWIVHAVQVNPVQTQEILIGTENEGVLRSHDRGLSWEDSNAGFSRRRIAKIVFPRSSASGLSASLFAASRSMVVFDPQASAWRETNEPFPEKCRVYSWLELPDGSGILAGTSRGILRKSHGSRSWEQIGGEIAKREIHDLASDPGGSMVFAGTDYGIYAAPASTLNFAFPAGMRYAPSVSSLAVSQNSRVLCATTIGLLESKDHGRTWFANKATGLPAGLNPTFVAADPSDGDRFWAGTSSGLFQSRDGGATWLACGGGWLHSAVSGILFLGNGRIAVADGARGGVFLSPDDGVNWKRIEAAGFSSPARTMASDPANPDFIYLGTESDGIYCLRLP